MRILIVHNYYKIPGGEDTVVENERKLLESHGHEVFFYGRSNEEIDKYGRLQKIFIPFNTVFSLRSYKDVLNIIDEKKISIVHVHNTVCVISPSVYYAAFLRKIPVVQTIHNFRLICPGASLFRDGKVCEECLEKSLFHSLFYNCYRNSRMTTAAIAIMESVHKCIGTYYKLNYICLTKFNKEKFLCINKKKKYINPDRVFLKPNFITDQRDIIPLDKRKKQIVYAGRLDITKGIRVLFTAWKNIKDYKLVVCGIGPEENWCRDFILYNKMKNIKLEGFISNSKVIDIIAESKAVILPTQWYEGFPMVLVESFACGTPALVSNIGNVNDIVSEGENGLHFQYNDPQSICDTVKKLENIDLTESTKYISDTLYSSEYNYDILLSIYQKLTLESID